MKILTLLFLLCSLALAQSDRETIHDKTINSSQPDTNHFKLDNGFSWEVNMGLASAAECGIGVRAQYQVSHWFLGIGFGASSIISYFSDNQFVYPLFYTGLQIDKLKFIVGIVPQKFELDYFNSTNGYYRSSYQINGRTYYQDGRYSFNTHMIQQSQLEYPYYVGFIHDIGSQGKWAYSLGLSVMGKRNRDGVQVKPWLLYTYYDSHQPNFALHYEF